MTSHTAPFDESVATLVTGSHTQGLSIVATPAGGSPIPLAVVGGRLSWDESRAPRVAGEFEVPTPTDAATRALLDPRTRVRVAVTVTYTLSSGVLDDQLVANLHLRRRRLGRGPGTLMLEVASDEALVIDSSQNASVTIGAHPDTVALTDGAGWIASMIIAGAWNLGETPPTVNRLTVPSLAAERPFDVIDQWQTISDIADQLDLDVYDPGDRVFRITRRPAVAAETSLIVKGGPGGALLDADEFIARDDWANFVVIRYEWDNSAGAKQLVWGTARVLGGPLAYTTVGAKIYTEIRDTPATTNSANNAALTVLSRMLSRSRSLEFRYPSAWWVQPGDTITYQPDAGEQQRHLVASVEHNLSDHTMRVRTRVPDNDQTLGA